jgi:poly(3-hydroxybutyrate) depolymerase
VTGIGGPRAPALRLAALVAAVTASCATPRAGGPGDYAPLPGIRTAEGAPPGGLPYRLRIPAASAAPGRLVVWLHPSGATLNAEVEALAPDLAAHGFALLVVTEKDLGGWTREEARRLLEVTLDAAARQPGVDGRRPALLGFSAGGQMALLLWAMLPGAFSGVAVMGAEPVEFGGGVARELAPPAVAAARATPLLVMEGAREPGAGAWRGLVDAWHGAGVALELRVAAGRGHEWLLADPGERAAFLGWLERLPREAPPG